MDEMRSSRRVICKHGADNSIEFVTVRTDAGYTVKATQAICKLCLDEIGADLAKNTRAVVLDLGQRLQPPHFRS
jgi:hypothetical protein